MNKNIIGVILKSEVCTIIICGSYKFEVGEELLIKEDCRIACIEEKEVDIRYRSDGLVRKISFTEREEANVFKDKLISLLGVIGWISGSSFPDEVARSKVRVIDCYSKTFSSLKESEVRETELSDFDNDDHSLYTSYLNKYNNGYSDDILNLQSDVTILKLRLLERYF